MSTQKHCYKHCDLSRFWTTGPLVDTILKINESTTAAATTTTTKNNNKFNNKNDNRNNHNNKQL